MASNARAVQARCFMRQCRQSAPLAARSRSSHRGLSSTSTSPDAAAAASPYSPSSFNRPLRSPLNTPPQHPQAAPAPSPLDHLPPPPPSSRLPPSERPIALPSSWTRPRTATASGTSTSVPTSRRDANSNKTAPNAKFTFTNWVRHSLGLPVVAPAVKPLPVHLLQNPYRARKQWPPDFHKLHPKQQFHFEKTFRRRALLKWARPNWNKWVRRLQRSMLLTAMLYFVFIAEPDGGTPFDGFRVWFFGKLKNLGGLNAEAVEEVRRLEEEAKVDRDRRLAEKRQKEEASPLWVPK